MSRLDVFINRMVSQRACLNHAAALTADMTGPVFELGLGNGRTYHHMREIMETRDIYVFERAVASHPDSTPANEMLILGDVNETLPQALTRFGPTAALIHAGFGGPRPCQERCVCAGGLALGGTLAGSGGAYGVV